jgi:hypothetical protein
MHKNNPHYYPTDIKFFPDERYALSSGSPGSICLWDIDKKKHLMSLRNDSLSLSIHPGGNYAIAYATQRSPLPCGDGPEFPSPLPCGEGPGERCHLIRIDYFYEFPGWSEWDESARPYLESFLTLYPDWTVKQVTEILIPDLQNRGYGWIKPEGVQIQLKILNFELPAV